MPLPGSTGEYYFGDKNDKREPEHLTETFTYTGPVWYQRVVTVPESWQGKRAVLFLERSHWETQAWLDGRPLGLRNSLSTPHNYELGVVGGPKAAHGIDGLAPGRHRLTVRVDNRRQVDLGLSSAISPEVGATWNGIIGRMELQATDLVWIDSIFIYPMPAESAARVHIRIRNLTGEGHSATLRIYGGPGNSEKTAFEIRTNISVSDLPESTIEQTIKLVDASRWDEFSPAVFNLSALLESTGSGASFSSHAQTIFGMRSISTSGRQLKWNGRTIILRGTVDNGTFPAKGYVPMDVPFWRQRLQIYKDYGFNHVRFHSWCPPDAAFTAADELGIAFQVENPLWIPKGDVSADDERMEFIREEAHRIVDTYGNHPSFALMSMGNEEGSGQDVFLGDLVRDLQRRDPRHLYTSTTQPDNIHRPDDYFVSAGPRWQNFRGDPRFENNLPDTSTDYEAYIDKARIDRPVIAHELGQWTVYPNFAERKEYEGPLQPRYLDIYREVLERSRLMGHAESFRLASGALTVALYKEEIEAVLRTRSAAGFQLLGLTDFPGYGPAFIGLLDTLGKSKGLIAKDEFRRFCGPTVPLLRLGKRTWMSEETLVAQLDAAHYGPAALDRAEIVWTLRDGESKAVMSGSLPRTTVPTGGLTRIGEIKCDLNGMKAGKCSIECSVNGVANSWDIWIYPRNLPSVPTEITITNHWSGATRSILENGGTVVLSLDESKLKTAVPCSFTTIFWSSALFPNRHETMGILCDPNHPALKLFPTGSHADWQWWELMSKAYAFDLTTMPENVQSIIQVIDDAAKGRRLGAVVECRVGRGKLLAISFDLESEPATRLVARQLRASLLAYAASPEFQPKVELPFSYLNSLFSL